MLALRLVFFQIANHGVPIDIMRRALALSETFFEYPDEEKLKSSPEPGAPLPAGYAKQPERSADKNMNTCSCFHQVQPSTYIPVPHQGYRMKLEDLRSKRMGNGCQQLPWRTHLSSRSETLSRY
ncbi:hypothetical protein Patl1_17797 [Pistacia atlantica]|uniref:Uncharacterized protein n=1 Tax=Pistacia atlantica TaxID=434234 RepID=A0ACC1BZ84_9ROSI|nr:hypothetical protein Patl1_17797 [Pistacia atlantica]